MSRRQRFLFVVCVVAVASSAGLDGEGALVAVLPVSPADATSLAESVCGSLVPDNETEWHQCIDVFLTSDPDLSANPPKPVQTRYNYEFLEVRLPKSHHIQLVLLVPQDEQYLLQTALVRPGDDVCEMFVALNVTYSLWTAIVHQNWTHSRWLRGPDVTSFKEKGPEYQVVFEYPTFEYDNRTKKFNGTLVWKYVGGAPTGTGKITNSCDNAELGDLPFDYIQAYTQSYTVQNLSALDTCTFTLHWAEDFEFTYQTPDCSQYGCPALPSEVKDIVIRAMEDGESEWVVRVRWSHPKRRPDAYNVTVEADRVVSVTVDGNATGVNVAHVVGAGAYDVTVRAIAGSWEACSTRRESFPERSPPSSRLWWAAGWGLALAAAAALAAAVAVAAKRRRRLRGVRHHYLQNLEQTLPKACAAEDGWEVRPERVTLHEVLGEGAFGVVRRGTLAPRGKEVAVKMLKDFPTPEEVRAFLAESELMKSVGAHAHVAGLLGCCSGRRPLLLVEYCGRGDLLSFLRFSWDIMVSKRHTKYYNNNVDSSDYRNDLFKKLQKDHPKLVVNKMYDLQGICDAELTSLDLLSFCRQIAKGMEFLASNRVVHRDLAARNVLVSADKTLKIADFGLSRDVYQDNQYKQKGNGKMPIKWMALESLTHRIYTTQSDVWSFGVVMWEVSTVGGAPYPAVPAARLPRLLRAGYRMPRPPNCSKHLYELMLSCWAARPRDRPTFAELHAALDALLNSACADDYLSLELDEDAPPASSARRYVKMLFKGNRMWSRGESYERPLKAVQGHHYIATQSNHYTSPPASLAKPQPV